jgi:hypothetical protein
MSEICCHCAARQPQESFAPVAPFDLSDDARLEEAFVAIQRVADEDEHWARVHLEAAVERARAVMDAIFVPPSTPVSG